jgi:membrane protease YdiL (CAAX protease family)
LALITGLQLAGIRGNNRLSWLAKPSIQYLVLAAAVGGLCAVVAGEPIAPVPMSMMAAQARLHAALAPAWAGLGVCLCAVLATEWLFRGWLLQRIGLPASVAVWTLVCTPLDPVLGVLTGTALGLLAQRSRSVWAAVCAHGCWCIASGLLGA